MPDAPEGEKSPKTSPRKPRREQLEDEGIEPEMPHLEWGEYLIGWLFEVGPTVFTGMGAGPVPPPHVESWQRQMGLSLSPWEVKTLLRLSAEYSGESALANKPDRPAPWQPDERPQDKVLAAIDQRNALRNLAKL